MADTESRNARKVRTGEVISLSGDKTVTVQITYRKHHPKYGKMMTISKKLHCLFCISINRCICNKYSIIFSFIFTPNIIFSNIIF